MNTPLTILHDPLDEALKIDAAGYRGHYIDDAGFTLRVMDALPLQAKLSSQKRFAIIFGMSSFAAVIATLFLAGDHLLIDASMDVATNTISPAVVALFTIMMVSTAASIAAILSRR